MNKEDLLRRLDLHGQEPAQEGAAVSITPAGETDEEDRSPTALKLDTWGLRQGADLLAESPRLQQTGLDECAVADFHGAAFEVEPTLVERCQDALRRAFLEQLLQTPAYRALHAATRLDPVAAGIAATAFAEQFADLRQRQQSGAGKEEASTLDDEMATLRAIGRAVTEAGKEVEECQEACAALGLGPGSPGSNDPHAIADLFRRVRSSPTLPGVGRTGAAVAHLLASLENC